MIYRISDATAQMDHTVTIIWSDGADAVVDLSPVIVRGAAFAALRDATYFVEKMVIAEKGLGLEWMNGVDFSADGLRARAFRHVQDPGGNAPR